MTKKGKIDGNRRYRGRPKGIVLRDGMTCTYTDLTEAIKAVNAKFQQTYLDAVDRASKEVSTINRDKRRKYTGKKGAKDVSRPKPR